MKLTHSNTIHGRAWKLWRCISFTSPIDRSGGAFTLIQIWITIFPYSMSLKTQLGSLYCPLICIIHQLLCTALTVGALQPWIRFWMAKTSKLTLLMPGKLIFLMLFLGLHVLRISRLTLWLSRLHATFSVCLTNIRNHFYRL